VSVQPDNGDAQQNRRGEHHRPTNDGQTRSHHPTAARAMQLRQPEYPVSFDGTFGTPQQRGTTGTAVNCEHARLGVSGCRGLRDWRWRWQWVEAYRCPEPPRPQRRFCSQSTSIRYQTRRNKSQGNQAAPTDPKSVWSRCFLHPKPTNAIPVTASKPQPITKGIDKSLPVLKDSPGT
jgi:hypothetical protein